MFSQDDVTSFNIGSKNTNVDPIFRYNMEPVYPGSTTSRTLRIYNDLDVDMMIKNIDMKIKLSRDSRKLDFNNEDAKDYMRHMNLKITYLNPLTRLSEGNIFEGSFDNFTSGKSCNILIPKNGNMELVYTLSMDREALVNIQNIEGKIDFSFKIDQVIKDDKEDKEEKNDKKDKDYEYNETWDNDHVNYKESKASDIKDTWAHDCIKTLLEKGIIKPYEDGTIRPKQFITRAETAVLVGRALGLEGKSNIENIYKDFIGKEEMKYILELTEIGILQGYPDGDFKPDNYITRQEMMKVLVLSFEKSTKNKIELKFEDKEDIGKWAIGYVQDGVYHKIIQGYPDNTFRPNRNITREEAFTIICKLLNLHQEHEKK